MAISRVNFVFCDALIRGFVGGNWIGTNSANNTIEIYSGTMPDDADEWQQYGGSPSPLLATFNTFRISNNSQSVSGIKTVQEAVFTYNYAPDPGTVNATGTGTAAWWAMYQQGDLNEVMIGDVSLSGGSGAVHLDSLNITSGNPVQLLHWAIRVEPGT